jgi:hypothetical protein
LLADEMIDLKMIQAAVEAYDSSISSLAGRYRSRIKTPVTDQVRREDSTMTGTFLFQCLHDRIRLEEHDSWFYGKISRERFEVRKLSTFDGTRAELLFFTCDKRPIPSKVPAGRAFILNSGGGNGRNEFTPWVIAGLRVRGTGGTLAALLKSPSAQLERIERVAGDLCYVVSMKQPEIRVWLDPRHDFLPRRQEFSFLGADGKPDPPHLVLETTTFEQFADAEKKEHRWFPKHCEVRSPQQVELVDVDELRINPPVDETQFTIDRQTLPDGVRVNDPGSAGRKVSYTGDRKDLWDEIDRQLDEETEELNRLLGTTGPGRPKAAPAVPPIPAVPATASRSGALLLVGASLLLILCGLRLARSRKM